MRGSASSSRSTAVRRGAARLSLDFRRTRPPSGKASPIKGRQAATDPVVRAGTNGLFYYAGVAFDRGEHKPSAIFVARFIDLNNSENGDPIAYLGHETGRVQRQLPELDKTALAVDIPRTAATCTLQAPQGDGTTVTQVVPAGNVYVAYAAFTGEGAGDLVQIMFVRSTNCGETWSTPVSIAPGTRLNQNAQIAIDPTSGAIYVSWRAFKSGTQGDGIFVAKSTNARRRFRQTRSRGADLSVRPGHEPHVLPLQRLSDDGDRRDRARLHCLVRTRSRDAPARCHHRRRAHRRVDVDDGNDVVGAAAIRTDGLGHEVMPALSFQAGRLRHGLLRSARRRLADLRSVRRRGAHPRSADPKPLRHTLDVYVAQAAPGGGAGFTAVRLSDYATGYLPGSGTLQQLQFNPPEPAALPAGHRARSWGTISIWRRRRRWCRARTGSGRFNTQPTGSTSRTPSGPTTATSGRRSTATGRTTRR